MKAESQREVDKAREGLELTLEQLAHVAGGSPTTGHSNKSTTSKEETPTESLSLNFTKIAF